MRKMIASMIFLTAVMMSAAVAGNPNLIYNPSFTVSDTLSEALQKIIKDNGISLDGDAFPKHWIVTSDGKPTESRVYYRRNVAIDGRTANVVAVGTNETGVVLYGHFYRLMETRLDEYETFMLSLTSRGEGTVEFGFYCYGTDGGFIGSKRFGKVELTKEMTELKSIAFSRKDLPDNLGQFVPRFTITGEAEIVGASLRALSEAEIKSLEAEKKNDDESKPLTLPDLSGRSGELQTALLQGSVDQRREAALAISQLDHDALPLLNALRMALLDEDEETVYHCIVAIAHIGPDAKAAVPDLLPLLDGKDQFKAAACYALGEIGEAAAPAVRRLRELANYPVERVNVMAAKALADIGTPARRAMMDILLGDNKVARLTLSNILHARPGLDDEFQAALAWASPKVMLEGDLNALANGSFEDDAEKLAHWEVLYREGAEGEVVVDNEVSRTGRRSLRVTKTNGKGYIEIKSAFPVTVSPGREPAALRMYFRSDDAPVSSAVLLRMGKEDGTLLPDDTGLNRGDGLESQSLARNAPPRNWIKRVIMRRRGDTPEKYTAHIIILGNPTTVWIDDVEFPATPWSGRATGPTYTPNIHTREEALEIIAGREPATAEIKRLNDRPTLLLNGKPEPATLYNALRTQGADYALFEQEAGIKFQLLFFNFDSAVGGYRQDMINWPGQYRIWDNSGSIDVGMVTRSLEDFARKAPNSNIILAFNICWPETYIDDNPDEVWLNENGVRGLGTAGHFRRFREELGPGERWWPSMYSQKALADAGKIVREIVDEIKKTPYEKMVAGVFIAGGHDGQFKIYWPDHSKPGKEAWRDFLRRRYGSDEALAKAWHDPDAKIDTAPIPDISGIGKLEPGRPVMFQDPSVYAAQADYNDLMDSRTWEIQDYFAGIVKSAFDRPIIGITWKMGGGWSGGFESFLQSRHLDICVPQPAYAYRRPGYIGGIKSPYESLALKNKIMVKELDLRSWTRGVYNEVVTIRISTAFTADEFRSICRKEAGQMFARGHGWWMYDIGGSAFRHPHALETIRQMQQVGEMIVGKPDIFQPGMAVVFNEKSFSYRRNHLGGILSVPFFGLRWMFMDIDTSGVPYHSWFFRHLKENPAVAEKYQVLVFVTPYFMSEKDRAFVETLKSGGRTIVWHYAPGYISPEGVDIEWVSRLTGMNCATDVAVARQTALAVENGDPLGKGLRPLQGMSDVWRSLYILQDRAVRQYDCQRFWIDDPEAVAIAAYEDGKTAVAVKRFKDWTSVYIAPVLGVGGDLLNRIAREAGAYVATAPGPAVSMNGNFLSIHGMVNRSATLELPWKATVRDAFSGKVVVENNDRFSLELDAHETYWYILEPK